MANSLAMVEHGRVLTSIFLPHSEKAAQGITAIAGGDEVGQNIVQHVTVKVVNNQCSAMAPLAVAPDGPGHLAAAPVTAMRAWPYVVIENNSGEMSLPVCVGHGMTRDGDLSSGSQPRSALFGNPSTYRTATNRAVTWGDASCDPTRVCLSLKRYATSRATGADQHACKHSRRG